MGKLVIYLADGSTMDVLLNKERITIGRRPDNDVCLPFPAVSGEHAQVVTILADSFLEDLGSTNGTIVNGKPVAKHFLNDHDQIDIGRQRLTYLSDVSAKVAALPPDIVSRQLRGLSERVDGPRPVPKAILAGDVRPQAGPAAQTAMADMDRAVDEASRASPPIGAVPVNPVPAALRVTERGRGTAPASVAERVEEVGVTGGQASAAVFAPPKAPPAAIPNGPAVRVLSGASQGRSVAFPGPELSVGRVGVQVAVVRKVETGGYLLIPLEGREPPRINGAPVAPEGSPLHPGDTFEVAGVRLELSVHS